MVWMVHGSEGRQEQILPTDQDNALAWQPAGGADPDGAIAKRVEGVARQVVDGLLAAGYPACPGGYMATHWHDPLSGWIRRFERWIAEPREEDGIDIHTFLDLRVVAGGLDLAADRRAAARRRAGPPFPARPGARGRRLGAAVRALRCAPRGRRGIRPQARQPADRRDRASLGARSGEPRPRHPRPSGGGGAGARRRRRDARRGLSLSRRVCASSWRSIRPGAPTPSSGHRIHLAALNALERRFLKDIFTLLRNVRDGLVARFAL